MKPYGMSKIHSGDCDVAGCIENGRATRVYSITGRAYKALRGGKKAHRRRQHKRAARIEGQADILKSLLEEG